MRLLFYEHGFQYPEMPQRIADAVCADLLLFQDDTPLDWGKELPPRYDTQPLGLNDADLQQYLLEFTLTRSRWYRVGDRIFNSRHNDWGAATLRNQAMHFLQYAASYLREHEPALAIFSRLPHTGLDYSFWTAVRAMKIPAFFFLQSPFPYRFMLCESMEDIGQFANRAVLREEPPCSLTKTAKHEWFYMQPSQEKSLTAKIMERPLAASVSRGIEMARQKSMEMSSQHFRAADAKANELESDYQRLLRKHARSADEVNFQTPFIYFALHLEPESSTLPRAGVYSDQLLALERLSHACPPDWLILAKENPKQNHFARDAYFFERLACLQNVTLLQPDVPSDQLIDSARIVATINGTAGWEALCSGTPAIYFGHPWYRELPGAQQFSPDMNVCSVAEVPIDHAYLEKHVSELQGKMLRGVIFKKFEALCPEFDHNQNLDDCANDIALFLTRNGYIAR